jgi:hypothetical protein
MQRIYGNFPFFNPGSVGKFSLSYTIDQEGVTEHFFKIVFVSQPTNALQSDCIMTNKEDVGQNRGNRNIAMSSVC